MVGPVSKQRDVEAVASPIAQPSRPGSASPLGTAEPTSDDFEAKSDHRRLLGRVERRIVGPVAPSSTVATVEGLRAAQAHLAADAAAVSVSAPWDVGDILMAPLRAVLPVRWRRAPGGAPTLRSAGGNGRWGYVEPETWPEFALNRETNLDVARYVDQGRGAPYDLIVVPGFSTEDQQGPLSARARERLATAASDWRAGNAPFILVTGGDVHPEGTAYIEAIEMRRYLIDQLDVPANRIIVEPNARHTTTNIRNAGRYMKKMGLERALVVSSPTPLVGQSSYLQNAGRLLGGFHVRCQRELGAALGEFLRVDGWRTEFTPFDTVNIIAREPDLRDP